MKYSGKIVVSINIKGKEYIIRVFQNVIILKQVYIRKFEIEKMLGNSIVIKKFL